MDGTSPADTDTGREGVGTVALVDTESDADTPYIMKINEM